MFDLASFSPSNFSRCVSLTEQPVDEPVDIDEWTSGVLAMTNETSSFMPIPTVSSVNISQNSPLKAMTLAFLPISSDVEPLPIPYHGHGPIQRPNKLNSSTAQSSTCFSMENAANSPGTPDVLDQINQYLYEHNVNSTGPSIPDASHESISSPMISDLASPSISWTPFPSSEWQSQDESSWSLGTLSRPQISLNRHTQNPFALMTSINEHQQQISRGELPVWSSALDTVTPRFVSSNTHTQRTQTRNELYSAAVPLSSESNQTVTNGWPRMWHISDPSETVGTLLNGQETVSDSSLWSLTDLSNDSVVPSSNRSQTSTSAATWWSSTLSDENNNKNSLNHDDSTIRDQSRWDFAR